MRALKIKWRRDNGCCLLTQDYSRHAKVWKLIDKIEIIVDDKPLFLAVLDNSSGLMQSDNMVTVGGYYLSDYKLW